MAAAESLSLQLPPSRYGSRRPPSPQHTVVQQLSQAERPELSTWGGSGGGDGGGGDGGGGDGGGGGGGGDGGGRPRLRDLLQVQQGCAAGG